MRGRGLAQTLLSKTLEVIRQKLPALKAVWVHVIAYNDPAVKLYERMGLQMVRRFPHFYHFQEQFWDSLLYVLYSQDGHPPEDLQAQVLRDEFWAMLASWSDPRSLRTRCSVWLLWLFCQRRKRGKRG